MMQLHELIDKCITWIAYDGILGTEPLALHTYIRRFDASVDDAYFAYLYSVLVEHPHIRVSITTEPLAGPDKTVRLGDAPLPDDFEVPDAVRNDVDISAMYGSGVKGRALAFHLSGQAYKSNAQAIEEKREISRQNALMHKSAALRKKRQEEAKKQLADPEKGLIRDLVADDGQGIPKADLNGLAQRWGSRLRLRCDDDEIYSRITGSHRKNPKITPVVWHTLSLAVKSREKGITAVELGPLVGCSQGSMHHYMKVLTKLGLCTKVSTTLHAALTNLLVFHAFLDENPNYRATKYGFENRSAPEIEEVGETAMAEQDGEIAAASGPATASDWGLQFPDLIESDMTDGLVIRERLTKLLDHPGLTNHLLRAKNLLPLLGWKSETALRHRRAAPKMLRAMLEDGQIEYVDVGAKGVRCIRLTKYNPDRMKRTASQIAIAKTAVARLHEPQQLVQRHSNALQLRDGCTMFRSMPYQIGDAVTASGAMGMRIPDIRDALFGLYRRMVEFHFSRLEKMTRPPLHLQHKRITTVMESEGRERRLRAFTIKAYRENLSAAGYPIDEKDHPPIPPEAGHFAVVSHRAFFEDTKSFDRYMDKMGSPAQGSKIITRADKPPPPVYANRSPSPSRSVPAAEAAPTPVSDRSVSPDPAAVDWGLRIASKPKYKAIVKSYDVETQVRGRPRKYIHVVRPDGTVDRATLGQILPHRDLAPIYIMFADIRKLVPAPEGYTGIGPPPALTEGDMRKAVDPEFFIPYPRPKGGKTPLALRPPVPGAAATGKVKAPSKKRKATNPPVVIDDAGSDADESGTTRRSKRPRKPVVEPQPQPEQEVDELIYSEDEIDKTDELPQTAHIVNINDNDMYPRLSEDVDMSGPSHGNKDDATVDATVSIEPVSDGPIAVATRLSEDAEMAASSSDLVDAATTTGDPELDEAIVSERPGPDQAEGSKPRARGSDHEIDEVALRTAVATAPQTPAHLQADAPFQMYTPPGFHHFTILPPVVYVPKGHTVWPPLPPGYPTTDIPPPGWQPSPVPAMTVPAGHYNPQSSMPPAVSDNLSQVPRSAAPSEGRSSVTPGPFRQPSVGSDAHTTSIAGPSRRPSAPLDAQTPSKTGPPRRPLGRNAHKERQPSPLREAIVAEELGNEADQPSSTPEAETVSTPLPMADSPVRAAPDPQPTGHVETLVADMAKDIESTRQRASASPSKTDLVPIRQVQTAKKGRGRMDLGPLRRANEMLTVLQQAGGVCEEHELWKRHAQWSSDVAGTDATHAPAKGYTMDRTVWKRLIASTKEDGRTDNTSSSVPTSTAQWVQNRVVWLTDCPPERVQSYMRSLANTTKKATAPRPIPSTKIGLIPYTEVKLPAMHPSSTVQYHLVTDIDAASRELSGEARRNELLKDVYALSQLLGRQSGKWARTATFHRGVREALTNPRSQKVLNRERGVFQATLLSQDISVGAWYATILTYERDDRLMEWLEVPENRSVPLWALPFDIRTTKEGRRQRARARIRTLVETLLGLGLLSTLSYCDDENEAYITVDMPDMPNTHLKLNARDAPTEGVMTYVLHDYAPVYHIAGPSPDILGYLPVRTEEEIDKYWDVYRIVCMEADPAKLPKVMPKSAIDSLNYAKTPDTLRIGGSIAGSMRQLVGWKNELKLLPVQREALNDAVDWATATTKVDTPEKLKALAWEYALPENDVREYLDQRLGRAKTALEKKHKREHQLAAARSLRTVNAQKAFSAKLQEQRALTRRKWESRVESICQRLMVDFDVDLLDFVSRQSITSMSKGSLTDEVVERIVRLYMKTKFEQAVRGDDPPPSMPIQPIPIARVRPSQVAARRRPFRPAGTRVRRKWTDEDDELILDAEAIIKARNRDITNGRGRAAMEQLFPNVLGVTFLARVKRSTSTSSGQAYLNLLSNAWYDLWKKHRGTDALPDQDFKTNIHFDLAGHIKFLREHLKKTELRVQASKMENQVVQVKLENQLELPGDVLDLVGRCRWIYRPTKHFGFDVLWQSHNSQETRLGQIGGISLVRRELEPAHMLSSLTQGKLRGIIKMVVATPSAQYDQTAAISLLRDYDQNRTINPEIGRMVHEKVLVKHNSATMTGRFYSFSQAWQTLAQGTLASSFYQEAAKLEDKISAPEGMEWPVMGSCGELAALMNMVSEHTVDFRMDPSTFPTVVANGGIFNTRRLTDISFEFGFKATKAPSPKATAEMPSLYHPPVPRQWSSVPDASAVDLSKIYEKVRSVGPDGLSKPKIQSLLDISQESLDVTLASIPTATSQSVFWAGYDTARLVHIEFWPLWQSSARNLKLGDNGLVISGGEGEIKCTPRRWVDIWGRRIDKVWEQAVGSARGLLISRPGLTERIIRQKLCYVMDRLEMNDVLQYLVDKRVARRVRLDGATEGIPPIEASGAEDEGGIVWSIEPVNLLA